MNFRKPLLALAILVFVGLVGWRVAGFYRHWRAQESVRQARASLSAGQMASAAFGIQASLAFESRNPDALQLAAELMEGQGDPKAIEFRKQLASLSPANAIAQISLAETALRFKQVEVARVALSAVPEGDRVRPEYLSAQAACLVMTGCLKEAAALYDELLTRFPGHALAKPARMNLARLYLGSPSREENGKAVVLLEPLVDDPVFGIESLRMRVRYALQTGNSTEAVRLATQLAALPKAALDDRLLQIDALHANRSPRTEPTLRALAESIAGNPDAEADLAAWILRNQGPAAAIQWLTSLPVLEQPRMPLPVVMADCHAALKNWSALESLLTGRNWGKMDAQRLGLLARAEWGLGHARSAARAWGEALNKARQQPALTIALARMASADGRMAEACEALWRIPATDPAFSEAQNQLFAYYQKQKDAGNLLRLLEQALTVRPDDPDLKRSTAALLLIGGRQIPRAARLAADAYRADPKQIANAAVYAFSLLLCGNAAKAEQILHARTEEERRSDSAVSYYVLILSARGRIDEARRYARSMNRQSLFPEMAARIQSAEAAWGPVP